MVQLTLATLISMIYLVIEMQAESKCPEAVALQLQQLQRKKRK